MIRIFETFAGIGAVRKAFINTGIPHEVVGISEIDKFAIQSYNALYGETKNFGDICKIDTNDLPDFDLMIFGSPCQSISIAGRQEGLKEGSGTQSSLLWKTVKIIKAKKPKYLLMENVKNLVSQKFLPDFLSFLEKIKELGYNSSWKVLNARNFGVPQNRERVICVFVLDDETPNLSEGKRTNLTIRDIAESNPDEKYYINKPFTLGKHDGLNGLKQVATIDNVKRRANAAIYSKDGYSPTLLTCGGGGTEAKILDDNEKIRKLTPREYWRLQGFSDEDFDKVRFQSDSQLRKQAGNSICVPMLESVLKDINFDKN